MAYHEDRRAISYPERSFSAGNPAFWTRRPGYYVIVGAVSSAFFMIASGLLQDNAGESPLITAAVGSAILLSGAVILSELVFRRARPRTVSDKRDDDRRNLMDEMLQSNGAGRTVKLSVEQNKALLAEIKKRSEAANVLNKFSAGHKDVFELCAQYLTRIEDELSRMNPGSPRLEPFLKGRSRAAEMHRFHMLRWAEIEATESTLRAQKDLDVQAQRDSAGHALRVVETALSAYPADQSLVASREVLMELAVSIDVKTLVKAAERAAFDGRYGEARQAYREALQRLAEGNTRNEERTRAAAHITTELEKITGAEDDTTDLK